MSRSFGACVLIGLWASSATAFASDDATLPALAKLLDRDGDRRVASDEMPGEVRSRLLQGLDGNGDGVLSESELMTIGRGGNGGSENPPPEEETADGVRVLRNVDYATGDEYRSGWGQLDLYLPAEPESQPAPVVLFFHGGGLYKGDKRSLRRLAPRLVADGYIVVASNYRLSPEYAHPAQVVDAAKAFRWLWDHADEHGGDRERIVVAGGSAGGYVAALLTYDGRYLAEVGLETGNIKVSAPLTALTRVETAGAPRLAMTWQSNRDLAHDASPMTHARAGAPPTLLMVADGDTGVRRRQNREFFDRLRQLGHPAVELYVLDDRLHSTILPNMTEPYDPTYRHLIEFMAKHGAAP